LQAVQFFNLMPLSISALPQEAGCTTHQSFLLSKYVLIRSSPVDGWWWLMMATVMSTG